MRLILASTSPRRREILALFGVPFETVNPSFEERISSHRSVQEEVLAFAFGKAQSVAHNHPDAIVIGSDTMIVLEGEKMGKPSDLADARRMLEKLAGKQHQIYTAVAIIDDLNGSGLQRVERVDVVMRHFSNEEITHYLARGESLDKAGAYSIQGVGEKLIASIHGDYLAAVGMPLKPIAEYLYRRGISFPLDVDRLYAGKTFLNWSRF